MTSAAQRRRRKKGLKLGAYQKATTHVSMPPMPWNGDHGTGTTAANEGTEITEVLTEDGRNPNRMARRFRVEQIDRMKDKLSMRQYQAGKAIRDAYCRCETLSSGGALKEQVDASPKPDAVVAAQVEAMSRLKHVMDAVPSAMRDVVEHVCWHNRAVYDMTGPGRRHYNRSADFKVALDLVANHLRY